MLSFPAFLKGLKKEALPGLSAQQRMMPMPLASSFQIPSRWHFPESARKGSVAVLLHGSEWEPKTLLTLRAAHLTHHPNQWAYPGGRNEANESLLATAIRETEEELFIPPASLQFLNQLSPFYIPVSHFIVFPHLFWVDAPISLHQYNSDEIAQLLSLPLSYFIDVSPPRVGEWELRGQFYRVPYWELPIPPPLWGATAMILSELLFLYEQWRENASPPRSQ